MTGENLNLLLPENVANIHEHILADFFNNEEIYESADSIERYSLMINKYQKIIPVKYSVEFRKSFCEGNTLKFAVCYVEPQDADYKSGALVIHPNNA